MADEADESRIAVLENIVEPEPPPPPAPPTRRIGGDRPRPAPQPEVPPSPTEGYVGPQDAMNDQSPAAHPPPPVYLDPIDERLANPILGTDMRLVMTRLREIEKHFPELVSITQGLINAQSRIQGLEEAYGQARQIIESLSQQRAVAEMQLDRHTRWTALDLAIKALPEEKKVNPDAIADFAAAFHTYIVSGNQH